MLTASIGSTLPLSRFLVNESHRQLSDINGVVGVVSPSLILINNILILDNCCLLLFIHLVLSACRLYWPESASSRLGIHPFYLISCSARWGDSDLLLLPRLSSYFGVDLIRLVGFVGGIVSAIGCRREKTLSIGFILSVVKGCVVLGVMSAGCTRSHSCHMGGICSVAVFPLDWLHHRIVQIYH